MPLFETIPNGKIMVTKNGNLIRQLYLISAISVFLIACDVRKLPVLKQEGERWQHQENIRVEEAVQKSPHLELDTLCREIPTFEKLEPVRKGIGKHSTFLSYNHVSNQNFVELKAILKNHYLQKGWQLTEENDGFVGDTIGFQKDKYKVLVTYQDFEDSNYSVECFLLNSPKTPLFETIKLD